MNVLLNTVGGVISVYILFALITANVVEQISTLLNKRGKTLYEGLVALLGDTARTAAPVDAQPAGPPTLTPAGVKADAGDKTARPLVDLLYSHPLISTLGDRSTRKPAYIQPRTFTLSLVSVLREIAVLKDDNGNPRVVDIAAAPDILLKDLRDRVSALGADNVTAKSLTMVLEGAEKNYDAALAAIDNWFNTQMDRVSGTYRRWVGLWHAVIALIIVALANADTMSIVWQLSNSSTISEALAAPSISAAGSQSVSDLVGRLTSAGLQLGWTAWPHDWGPHEWLMKVCGLVITFAAVMLGAPFWFDLLKQIVPVRTEGAKPSDPHAASRDAQRNGALAQ